MKNHLILILFACLMIGLLISNSQAQTGSSAPSNAAVKTLRDIYFTRDFDAGYEAGQKLIKQFPADDELRMWVILNGVRTTENNKISLEMAKEMAASKSDSVPALIALSMANSYIGNLAEALKAADSAIQIAPDNEEAIFAKNTAFFRASKFAESIEWLEKNADKIKDRSRFHNTRALSNYLSGKKDKGFEDFAASLNAGPVTVNSLFLYADYLSREKRLGEALPLLKKALQLAPDVLANRAAYWRMVSQQTDKTDEQKEQEVAADMNALLKARPNSPEIVYNVALQYGIFKNVEKQAFYEAQVLKRFPDTRFAELILVQRIFKMNKELSDAAPAAEFMKKVGELNEAVLLGDRALLNDSYIYINPDKKGVDKINEAWRAFIDRPRHFDMNQLGTAYYRLFYATKYDAEISDQKLKELRDAVKKYRNDRNSNTNTDIADLLAVRKVFGLNPALTGEMLSYAQAGIAEGEADIADFRTVLNAKDLERQAKYIRTYALETLGFALYLENRFDDAEKELLKASQVDSENTNALLKLALVYKARKEYEKAEDIYLKHAAITRPFTTSIKDLYRMKNGDLNGFDPYYSTVKEKIRTRIMAEVAASRIKEPKDLTPFNLKTIDQRSISSEDVKGKVVVINFWGVWCGPCVKEMPEVQELATKYKNDRDVALLTFDSQDDLATVKKFIADKKYDFPVLVADSYTENLGKLSDGMVAYPTTLFVDKQGKISFIKVGNTGNLVEEFSLRIDILKQDK